MASLLAVLLALGGQWSVGGGATAKASATTTQFRQTYAITARLNPDTGWLGAVERVTLTNQASYAVDRVNLSVLPRAFGYFALTGLVKVDGVAAAHDWTTGTNLEVRLAAPLQPGATLQMRIPFRLRIGSSGGAFTARLSRDRGVISLGEWFPIVSREHGSYGVGDPQVTRTADEISVDLTTTRGLRRDAVACPGLERAPTIWGRHWTCRVHQVRDFSLVVNPRFHLTRRWVDGVAIRVYTQTVSGWATASRARTALARLDARYGQYPWKDLVLAEVGADGGFSMEYPRAIHLTRSKVADAYVINHEVAHQWFYAQLGNDQLREPWLDEGFADFTARWLMGVGESQCSTREVDSPIFAWPAGATSGGDWLSCDGYFHTVFYKATEFLNQVRDSMGSPAFFGALRDYLAAHRYGLITTRDLLDFLQSRSAVNLRPLYRRYLDAYD